MKVILATKAGFCFGVKKAVKTVYDNINEKNILYTLGPIIHNPFVVSDLENKGVLIADNIEDISNGTVIIRSHGVAKELYNDIKNKGLDYIDATCPYVLRIHRIVEKFSGMGHDIIIIGEQNHPEVKGIIGWSESSAYVINEKEDIRSLPEIDKACVVSQTTIQIDKWDELIPLLRDKIAILEEFNTICYATTQRQNEAKELAKHADKMIVIGGKKSSNTKKLYNISKLYCENTFAVESADDFELNFFNKNDVVGITAGASTPDWIIKEVINKMMDFDKMNNDGMEDVKATEELTDNIEIEETEDLSVTEDNDLDSNDDELEDLDSSDIDSAVGEESEDLSTEESEQENKSDDEDIVEEDDSVSEEITTMEDFEETMVSLRKGQIVDGKIISVNDAELIVNIGYKADGILPLDEVVLNDDEKLSELYKEDDEIEVEVLKVNDGEGNVVLSQKSVERKKAWKLIEKGFEAGEEFTGICTETVKGGVIARINGVRSFVPASQLSDKYVEDLNVFVGQNLRLKIIELERGRRRVVASQRVILEEEAEAMRKELWEKIEEGQKINGVVKRLTNFGAFVDIGGVDGLIHISDLSWGHIDNPREVLTEEDNVEVIILSIDRERERISLGYKQTMPHPWDNVEDKYPTDAVVKGKVVRITTFGAFVELEPGVDGLVHISQVANRRIEKVEEELSIGQEIDVKVLDSNSENKRISLSIRELLPEEPKVERKVAKKPAREKTESKFEKEDMTVSLGEFFPDDYN